jgi:hypothetical protein
MPYVTSYKTLSRTLEQDLGYDLISIIRPNFVFFQFVGMRPSTPHWIFFDGKDVTKWTNTSYTIGSFKSAARNDDFRNAGDKFITSTSFPSTLGGPTNATGPVYSDSTGKLEGVFYIQSNASLSFSIGKRTMTAIDISVLNKKDCLSYAEAEYTTIGDYQIYYEYQQEYQEAYQVWVEPDPPVNNNNNNNDNDNGYTAPVRNSGNNNQSSGFNTGNSNQTSSGDRADRAPSGTNASGGGGGFNTGNSNQTSSGDRADRAPSGASGKSGCFIPETLIDMADGTTKAIADIRLGDITKGGKVLALHIYDGAPLYNYNGVHVSGTHYVIENSKAIMVKDTTAAIKVDDVYGLYTINTTERRIFSNGIEFADHSGDEVIADFFRNMTGKDVEQSIVDEIENLISAAKL